MNELRDKEGRTPGQVAIEAWNNYIKKGWDERFESMAQAVLDAFGAQVSQQAIIAAWRAGWDAADIKSYKPETYADSITFAPEREPLPYTAEEVADAVLSAWCNSHGVPPQPGRIDPHGYKAAIAAAEPFCAPPAEPKREPLPYTAEEIADDILRANGCAPRHYPRTRAHTVAAVAKFCAPPASTSKEDDPEAPVYKKGHEPKAIVTAHFTEESQRYPAPSGFSAWPAEPIAGIFDSEKFCALTPGHVAYNAWKRSGGYSGSWDVVAQAVLDAFGAHPPVEPTLDEIRALAAKHGMVLRPAHVLVPKYELGPPILSKDAQNARKPLPPDVLADALQDAVHKGVGRTRPAKTAKSLTVKLTAPDARFGSGKW